MPDTAYKLTDENMRTHGGCQWKLGEWKETSGEGELCGDGWIHLYDDPLVAVYLNPIHADVKHPRLFEAECEGKRLDGYDLEHGRTRVRLVKELPVPEMSTAQRVRAAILCAWEVCEDKAWRAWARGWLDGTDRGSTAAAAAVATDAQRAVLLVEWIAAESASLAAAAAVLAAAESVQVVFEAEASAAGASEMASLAASLAAAASARVSVLAAYVSSLASEAAPLDLLAILRRAIADEAKLGGPSVTEEKHDG